jgi:hypothetical protein
VNPDPAKVEPVRKDYLQQAEDLERLRRDGVLDLPGRVSLGGCLLRLGRAEQARAILEEGLRLARPNASARFLLLLNLAAACQDSDELLPRAVDFQRQALAAWPAAWPGWDRKEWLWYLRVEKLTLTLLQGRQREAIAAGGRSNGFQKVDALFPGVAFVGHGDEFEAGSIPLGSWEALPIDAEQVVLQMLLSRPHDLRLLWLYGELLNARGQITGAYQVFDYLVYARNLSTIRELARHRAVLKYALPAAQVLQRKDAKELLLWWLAPRGLPIPAGVGGSLNELAWPAAEFAHPGEGGGQEFVLPQQSPQAQTQPLSAAQLPELRTFLVGFGVGVVAAVLAVYQWQEWHRRRRRPAWSAAKDARPYTAPPDEPRPAGVTPKACS